MTVRTKAISIFTTFKATVIALNFLYEINDCLSLRGTNRTYCAHPRLSGVFRSCPLLIRTIHDQSTKWSFLLEIKSFGADQPSLQIKRLPELCKVGCETDIDTYKSIEWAWDSSPGGLPNPQVDKRFRKPNGRPLRQEEPPVGQFFLQVNYLRARINFCSAWICLLIDAINATIDCRT